MKFADCFQVWERQRLGGDGGECVCGAPLLCVPAAGAVGVSVGVVVELVGRDGTYVGGGRLESWESGRG